jgi:hypothetical protein
VCTGIAMLEYKDLTSSKMLHNMGLKNLIDISGSCHTIAPSWTNILKNNLYKFSEQSNATPYHDVWSTPGVPFYHTIVRILFSSSVPHSLSTISGRNAVTAFVSEDDVPPLLMAVFR